MKVKTLAVAATLVFCVVCGNNTEQPTSAEAFFGELAVKDLQEPNPDLNISIDSVVFTVESRDYRLDHITNNTGIFRIEPHLHIHNRFFSRLINNRCLMCIITKIWMNCS